MTDSTLGRRVLASLASLTVAAAAVLLAAAPAAANHKLSHREAAHKLRAANITWSSSGGCHDRDNPTCTSFQKIRKTTVRGIKTFKRASDCRINITGGTETGHASGTYSHWNGYKVDISHTGCTSRYIRQHYDYVGGSVWESPAGNHYYDEGDHWDITYYSCGC